METVSALLTLGQENRSSFTKGKKCGGFFFYGDRPNKRLEFQLFWNTLKLTWCHWNGHDTHTLPHPAISGYSPYPETVSCLVSAGGKKEQNRAKHNRKNKRARAIESDRERVRERERERGRERGRGRGRGIEKNRIKQNRTGQNRTEQNRIE